MTPIEIILSVLVAFLLICNGFAWERLANFNKRISELEKRIK